ncbi:MAG: sulfite exporter TauE/SafE family protein, partial [Patescibacteria group bacterium]|nr:sulfite exporter TauE/SafE family protein [Patescibacteria group bacterium]
YCVSCEILIEDELAKIPGIKKAYLNHQAGTAEIYYEGQLNYSALKNAIESAGYALGKEKLQFISRNYYDYIELSIAFLIVLFIFLILKTSDVLNLTSSISGNYSSLPVVLLIGLTAGISSCMALVGGLVLGASARYSEKHPNATGMEKFKPHLFFNIGRILSFFILGGLIGYAGSFFQLSTSVLGIMIVVVGLVMFLLGSQLIDIFPILKKISFTMPKGLSRMLGIKDRSEVEYSNKNAAIMGALTFFLPCGFTQAMQLYAMSTGSPAIGALTMGVFAIGTAPGLLSVGGLTSFIKGQAAKFFFRTVGIVVIFLAIFNISNGFNLLGINPDVFQVFGKSNKVSANSYQDDNVKLINGVQEVRMIQDNSGYVPNSFTIKKGIPVKWIITSEVPNSCAASIVSQGLGVRQILQAGENVIEFNPDETGIIRFSCSMGMYTGYFEVVDNNSSSPNTEAPVADQNVQNTTTANPGAGQSCGGSGGGGCGGCGGGGGGCGAKKNPSNTNTVTAGEVTNQGDVQLIKAVYDLDNDIVPNRFVVRANQPVKFEIEAKDDGVGCMGSVTIPGLTNQIEVFSKGQSTTFDFTPTKKGIFNITCAMGVPRGQIEVN